MVVVFLFCFVVPPTWSPDFEGGTTHYRKRKNEKPKTRKKREEAEVHETALV
jgi:hypothetical protein